MVICLLYIVQVKLRWEVLCSRPCLVVTPKGRLGHWYRWAMSVTRSACFRKSGALWSGHSVLLYLCLKLCLCQVIFSFLGMGPLRAVVSCAPWALWSLWFRSFHCCSEESGLLSSSVCLHLLLLQVFSSKFSCLEYLSIVIWCKLKMSKRECSGRLSHTLSWDWALLLKQGAYLVLESPSRGDEIINRQVCRMRFLNLNPFIIHTLVHHPLGLTLHPGIRPIIATENCLYSISTFALPGLDWLLGNRSFHFCCYE